MLPPGHSDASVYDSAQRIVEHWKQQIQANLREQEAAFGDDVRTAELRDTQDKLVDSFLSAKKLLAALDPPSPTASAAPVALSISTPSLHAGGPNRVDDPLVFLDAFVQECNKVGIHGAACFARMQPYVLADLWQFISGLILSPNTFSMDKAKELFLHFTMAPPEFIKWRYEFFGSAPARGESFESYLARSKQLLRRGNKTLSTAKPSFALPHRPEHAPPPPSSTGPSQPDYLVPVNVSFLPLEQSAHPLNEQGRFNAAFM
ncbi:hypothetical protein H9P43_005784 [Blastocladiella emersonii ATCC 22665]|nr:hypothetical protein H9P43_005784 [Blastocladiella emersonii ATCC 22665]